MSASVAVGPHHLTLFNLAMSFDDYVNEVRGFQIERYNFYVSVMCFEHMEGQPTAML